MKVKSKSIQSLILGISLMLILGLLLVACSSPPAEEPTEPDTPAEAPVVEEPAAEEPAAEEPAAEEPAAEEPAAEEPAAEEPMSMYHEAPSRRAPPR